jgi:hypothetical protein
MFLIFLIEIMFLIFSLNGFFFFLVLLDNIFFFISINCCIDCIYDNFKFKYYLLLECMEDLFMDILFKMN